MSVLQIPTERKKKQLGFIVGASGIGKDYGLGRVLQEYHGVMRFVSGDWSRDHATELAANGIKVDDQRIVEAAIASYKHMTAQTDSCLTVPGVSNRSLP